MKTKYYYAVAVGRVPGVYETWDECKSMVDKIVNAKYKKFSKKEDAERFVKTSVAPILSKLGITIEPGAIAAKHKEDDVVSRNPDALIAFTDGSTLNNGRKNAKAGWAVVFPNHPSKNVAMPLEGPLQTNNRAEYMACIKALQISDEIDPSRTQTLHLYTDSMLLKKSVTEWMAGWKARGWKKADGQDVANLDLVKQLDKLVQGRRIKWTHVEAHTGRKDWASQYNDQVDKMAQLAARTLV